VTSGSEELVAMLLHAGADVASSSNALLLSAIGPEYLRKFDMLVEAGAHIDPLDMNLIFGAVKNGSLLHVERLLQAGFTAVERQDLLITAVETGSKDMVMLLRQARANILGHDDSIEIGHALIAAATHGHENILSLLVEAGEYSKD
jgi:ankyrin repeat protein